MSVERWKKREVIIKPRQDNELKEEDNEYLVDNFEELFHFKYFQKY